MKAGMKFAFIVTSLCRLERKTNKKLFLFMQMYSMLAK